MSIDHIAITSPTQKISKHDRRKLRNMAYHTIKNNSPGAPKGIVKQVAFTRAKKAFAAMERIDRCLACGKQFMVSSLVNQQCAQCLPKE